MVKKQRTDYTDEQESLLKQLEILKKNKSPCPKCGNKSLEIVKRGFESKKFAIFLGLGFLLGIIGIWIVLVIFLIRKDKLVFKCKKCEYKWK